MEASTTLQRKKERDKTGTAFVREIILQGVYFLLGLLVSRGAVLGELAPFGASFAAASHLRYTPAAVAGSVLGYILLSPSDTFRYVAVVLSVGALKWLLWDLKKISKSGWFAPLVAFVPMVATGITLLFVSTSKMSQLSVCVIEALIAGAGAYFISKSASLMTSSVGIGTLSQQELACLSVSVCILILSFGSLSVLGVSVGRTLAVLVVLLCARYGGVTGGSISGIATGVVFSLSSSDMAFLSGGYAFGGLVGGLFSVVGKLPVGAAFTLCSTVLSFASGDNRLVLSLLIECILATGVFMLIPTTFGSTVRAVFMPAPDRSRSEVMRRSVTMRLAHCAKALEGVSECVTAVSQKLKEKCDSGKDVYANAADKTCRSCGLRVYCWEKQKDVTADDFSRLDDTLRCDGFVSERTLDEKFTKKCCKPKELAKSINDSYKEHLCALSAQRRISQVRSVVAGQFVGLGDMLSDLSEEFEGCDDFDIDSSQRIISELRNIGLVAIDCCCRIEYSKGMTVELELAAARKNEINLVEIHRLVSRCCGRRFERPVQSNTVDRVRIVMSQLSDFDVEIGSSQHTKGNGALCGDCLSYFMNGMGSMVAVVSDGMGSGGTAAVDSNMAVSVFKKLIKAGISYDCALSVVNSSLMIKSEEESMATVDVVDINLFSGKVDMYKAGAPVTFVRKGGRVHRREFPSLPVGILCEARFCKDAMTLHDGDAVLMVSDGALCGDDKWLEDLLRGWQQSSAQDFASAVVNEALKRRGDGQDDDISVVAIRLIENE